MKPAVAIIGCGKVGTSIGFWLKHQGYPIAALASRSPASARQAAQVIGEGRVVESTAEAARQGEIVFLTTPDDRIRPVCEALAADGAFGKSSMVFHCSGAHASDLLDAAKDRGAATGSLHPLQSFARVRTETNPFAGIIISIEGDPTALAVARTMATALGGNVLSLRTEGKTLYHAAAVAASNYLVTLMDFSLRMLAAAGVEKSEGFAVLRPLIEGTLKNIGAVGTPQALTGPIERGDADTVAAHVERLTALMPEFLPLYHCLGQYTVKAAQAKGSLDDEAAERLRRLLAFES